jgi:hypothetical protein
MVTKILANTATKLHLHCFYSLTIMYCYSVTVYLEFRCVIIYNMTCSLLSLLKLRSYKILLIFKKLCSFFSQPFNLQSTIIRSQMICEVWDDMWGMRWYVRYEMICEVWDDMWGCLAGKARMQLYIQTRILKYFTSALSFFAATSLLSVVSLAEFSCCSRSLN